MFRPSAVPHPGIPMRVPPIPHPSGSLPSARPHPYHVRTARLQRRSSSMISEEDVPASVPPCSELAPGRNVKPMRDEPGSDSDADESEERTPTRPTPRRKRATKRSACRTRDQRKECPGKSGSKECLGKSGSKECHNAWAKTDKGMPGQKQPRKGRLS